MRWNNPRLHTPDRRKIWLACEEHRVSLAGHLEVRGFLRDVVAVDALPDSDSDSRSDSDNGSDDGD